MVAFEEVKERRDRIKNLVEKKDSPFSYNRPMEIANEFQLDYETIKKDIQYLRASKKDDSTKYNKKGVRDQFKQMYERMQELQELAKEIQDNKKIKDSNLKSLKIKCDAIELEMKIINDKYHLLSDGLYPISKKIAEEEPIKEYDKLEEQLN